MPVLDDDYDEGEETFLLRLSNAQGAVIADRVATGTIETRTGCRGRGWRASGAPWPSR